jgi:hypothetical protein
VALSSDDAEYLRERLDMDDDDEREGVRIEEVKGVEGGLGKS